ncbi:MAG: LacI family DNA-binding transcriptional regulator [Cellulosilyticaceae bacterium]
MNEKKIITAKDIAKTCGISQATVSYVINNKEGKKISDKTRNLVLETARNLDYIPNSSARTMRTNKSMSIGVVTGRNCINVGFNQVIKGIKRYADAMGYSVTLLNDDDSDNKDVEYMSYFRANKIDGILFMFYDMNDSTLTMLEENHIPYLIINENGVWGKDMEKKKAFVEVINQCAQFCKEKKLKRIRFMSVISNGRAMSYKYNLFEQAVGQVFPEADFKRIFCQGGSGTNQEIIEQVESYMAEEEFDIVITPNQRLGLLTQSAILKKQFVIPQKIKHICLGASHVFCVMYPTITSVKIQLEEMGEYGAIALLSMIRGEAFEEKAFECILEYGMSTDL